MGWPFSCPGFEDEFANDTIKLVNYVRDAQHVGTDQNEYVVLAKVSSSKKTSSSK